MGKGGSASSRQSSTQSTDSSSSSCNQKSHGSNRTHSSGSSLSCMSSPSCITSIGTSKDLPREETSQTIGRREHHLNGTKTLFRNPWPSFNEEAVKSLTAAKFLLFEWKTSSSTKTFLEYTERLTPQWNTPEDYRQALKATWLGHACFLVELPRPEGATRGVSILFDPVFCKQCAPWPASRLGKTARFSEPPCKVEDIQYVDMVVISHNHYDHLDTEALEILWKGHRPQFLVPLNNKSVFQSNTSIRSDRIHEMDWWQYCTVTAELPTVSESKKMYNFEVGCVPTQHQSNRGLLDRNRGLWAGFTVTSIRNASTDAQVPDESLKRGDPFSCFFAGDTGYAYSEDDNVGKVKCPAFKETGALYGGFDLALLPIGAYEPRQFLSSVHSCPKDSVEIYKDVRARKAFAIHWGTYGLANEPLHEPPELLREAVKEANKNLNSGSPQIDFDICKLGELQIVECTQTE